MMTRQFKSYVDVMIILLSIALGLGIISFLLSLFIGKAIVFDHKERADHLLKKRRKRQEKQEAQEAKKRTRQRSNSYRELGEKRLERESEDGDSSGEAESSSEVSEGSEPECSLLSDNTKSDHEGRETIWEHISKRW
jgi:hypothetical protein